MTTRINESMMGIGRPLVYVQHFGAKCDGSTDDAAAVQAAINSLPTTAGLEGGIVLFPAGKKCVIKSAIAITNLSSFKLASSGGGKFAADLVWGGAANGKMFNIVNSSYWEMDGLTLIGNANSDYGIYMGGAGSISQWRLKSCVIVGMKVAGAKLGSYTEDSVDTDIGIGKFEDCILYDNKYNIMADSIVTSTVNLIGTSLTSTVQSPLLVDSHIYAKRLGTLKMIGGYVGPCGDGKPVVDLVEGTVEFEGVDLEYGPTGSTAYIMKATAQSAVTTHRPSSFKACNFWGNRGFVLGTGSEPVLAIGSSFMSSDAVGSWPTAWAELTGSASYKSIGNTYFVNASLAGTHPFNAQLDSMSLSDRYTSNGSAFSPLTDIMGATYREISTTPYSVPRNAKFINVDTTAGAKTLNLPKASTVTGMSVIISNMTVNGGVTIAPYSGEKINNVAASIVLRAIVGTSVVLTSNAYDGWMVHGIYPANAIQVAIGVSTGVGSVKMNTTNAADNTDWIEIAPGKWVPTWNTPNP
jgi:hypothetical protein